MGLDMNLMKKTYVSRDEREKLEIAGIKGIDPKRVEMITEDVGYWRKANQIHSWFVQNVQDNVDDCKEYYVDTDQLKDLLYTVNKVLDSSKLVKGKIQNGSRSYKDEKTGEWISNEPVMEDGEYIEDPTVAKELLPRVSGFFFGGTEYDQYYIEDLKHTKEILEQALANKGDYYYSSSW